MYTFCYDHDIAFGDSKAGLAPNRCFSNTSRGESIPEAATASREKTTSPNHIGPLFVSQNKFGVSESNDGDDPLAYDAAKLDDCLTALVQYDVRTYGQPLPIAVIGNSMGGAITRGWMQLAKSRNSPALEGVTTIIEGATQGSWIAAVGEGVDNGLFVGGLLNDGLLALDQIARTVAANSFHANPGRAGIQDLAPQSAWYRSIVASGAPPRLHYFALSVDITLDFRAQLLWWNNDLGSTDFIGDGVIQLGSQSSNAAPQWGGSQFLPFGSATDQHQYVIRPPTYIEQLSLEPSPSPPFVSISVNASNPYSNPYNHFNFGTYMGKENAQGGFSGGLVVNACASRFGTISIPAEFSRVLEDPADACGRSAPAPSRDAGMSAGPQPRAAASSTTLRRLARLPVVFRDRRGRALLELNPTRGPTQGQFTLEIAQYGTFVAALARKLATRRVIDLDTIFNATKVGAAPAAVFKLRLRGTLVPANAYARLTIDSTRPRLRTALDSTTPSPKAAIAASERVIALVAGDDLRDLARMLAPALLAGRSPATVAATLRAAGVRVKSIQPRGTGRLISLPDGNPGLVAAGDGTRRRTSNADHRARARGPERRLAATRLDRLVAQRGERWPGRLCVPQRLARLEPHGTAQWDLHRQEREDEGAD